MFKFAKNLFFRSFFCLGLVTAIGWIAHSETPAQVQVVDHSSSTAQTAPAPVSEESEPQEFSYVQPSDSLGSIAAELKTSALPAAPVVAAAEKPADAPKECKDGKDKDGKECKEEVAAGEKKEGTEEAALPPPNPEGILSQYYNNQLNDPNMPQPNTTASNNTAPDQPKAPDLPLLPDRFPSSSSGSSSSYSSSGSNSSSGGSSAVTADDMALLASTTVSSASFVDSPYKVSGQTVSSLQWGPTSTIDNNSAHFSIVKSGASVEVDVQFSFHDTAGAPPASLKMIPISASAKSENVGNNSELLITMMMPAQTVQGQLLTNVKVEMVYQKTGNTYQLVSGSGLTFSRSNVSIVNVSSQAFVASELSYSMNVSK